MVTDVAGPPGQKRERLERNVIERSAATGHEGRDRNQAVVGEGRASGGTALMIDDPSSRDLDDAFTVRPAADGWRVQVFIAAAADLIPAGGADDVRARERVESTYLPCKTIPMLGERIERAATLSDRAQRSALSIAADIDRAGNSGNVLVSRATLPAASCVRLSYQQVPELLEDQHHPLHEQVSAAHELSQTLLAGRRAAGALALYDLTRGFEVTEDGAIARIPQHKRTVGYVIVQEMMIAANAALATWCIDQELAILFRNHRTSLLGAGGADLATDIVASLHDPKLFSQLQDRITRTYGKAVYDRVPRGHHGLSLMAYTHGTSPLRRYADLVTERIIFAHLDGQPNPYSPAELDAIAEHINTAVQERRQQKSEHFKEQSRKAAVADILANDYSSLDPKQWRKMFDLMTKVAPVAGIETELNRRLAEGILLPNDVARLATAQGPDWQRIQRRLYPKVRAAHPEFGASAISGWAQITGQSVPVELDESRDPGRAPHQPRFAVRARMGDQVGHWQIDSSKKAAQAQAMWELLAVVGGHLPSSPDEAVRWPAPDEPDAEPPAQPPATVTATTPAPPLRGEVAAHLASLTPVKRARAADNPVGWLGSLAVTYHLGPVDYTYAVEGPQHAPIFTCTASLAGRASTQSSSSKNQARVAAAEKLVRVLLDTADESSTMDRPGGAAAGEGDTSVGDGRKNEGGHG